MTSSTSPQRLVLRWRKQRWGGFAQVAVLTSRAEGRGAKLRRCAPYCLEPIPGRPGVLAVLNRRYRPVGEPLGPLGPGGPASAGEEQIVERRRLDLRWAKEVDGRYYLFSDATAPWRTKGLESKHARRVALVWKKGQATAVERRSLMRAVPGGAALPGTSTAALRLV